MKGAFTTSMMLGAALTLLATAWSPPPARPDGPARPALPAAAEPAPTPPLARPGAAYTDGRARFTIRVGGVEVPLRVMALPISPGATVDIAGANEEAGSLSVRSGGGVLEPVGTDRWRWRAPESGFHSVRVVSTALQDTIHVTFMVARAATEIRDGVLDRYRIGSYTARPSSMSAAYEPPSGFVEARAEHHDILVSPNLRLGQFLCKQPGDPQFLLVSPRLLVKLEALLTAVNEAGHVAPSLTVMSGFRTPWYNRSIGNTTDFSRHLWGDAADVFVDADDDGQMDDVNGDGRIDVRDAQWLADRMEQVMASSDRPPAAGGLSVYRPNAAHGPFVHVDARGQRARW